jgi:hypothetical protein
MREVWPLELDAMMMMLTIEKYCFRELGRLSSTMYECDIKSYCWVVVRCFDL